MHREVDPVDDGVLEQKQRSIGHLVHRHRTSHRRSLVEALEHLGRARPGRALTQSFSNLTRTSIFTVDGSIWPAARASSAVRGPYGERSSACFSSR